MSSCSESSFFSECSRLSNENFSLIEKDSQLIQVVRKLGSGSFGECLLVLYPSTNKFLAVKRLCKLHIAQEDFQREYEISRALSSNKNIVQTFPIHMNSDSDYLLFQEWAPCGDLFEWIEPLRGLPLTITRVVTIQICSALKFMHQKGLVHRDIKPENILVFKADFSNIKLADFGMTWPCGTKVYKSSGGIPYSPPESLRSGYRKMYKVDATADIWSLGILLFSMLTGNFPWELAVRKDTNYLSYLSYYSARSKSSSSHNWCSRICCSIPSQFSHINSRYVELLLTMLNPKSKKRCHIQQVQSTLQSM